MPTRINNMDIAGICDRVATYANFLINCESAFNPDYFTESDKEKCQLHLNRLEVLIGVIPANAPMDLPKANGTGHHSLKDFPVDEILESVENQDIRDILRRYRAMWVDLSSCRSSDLSSGLNQYDLQIFNSLLENCKQILQMSNSEFPAISNSTVNVVNTPTGSNTPII